VRSQPAWGPTPRATGPSSRCDLSEQRWLFVISLGGRTGSTSLLGMLNAHPAIALSGENSNQLSDLLTLWNKASMQTHAVGAYVRGALSPNDLLCDLQRWVLDINGVAEPSNGSASPSGSGPAERGGQRLAPIAGFKEVLWSLNSILPKSDTFSVYKQQKTTVLDFADMLFPCSRFIFNLRENTTALAAGKARLRM